MRIIEQCEPQDSGCLLWNRAVGKSGYGVCRVGSRSAVSCHRLAWEQERGSIPEGDQVLHTCDVKRCCNPDHLYLGSARDNKRDAVDRGKVPSGSRCWNSHFSDAQVMAIRTDSRAIKVIAAGYGVHRQIVWRVKRGVTYTCVK